MVIGGGLRIRKLSCYPYTPKKKLRKKRQHFNYHLSPLERKNNKSWFYKTWDSGDMYFDNTLFSLLILYCVLFSFSCVIFQRFEAVCIWQYIIFSTNTVVMFSFSCLIVHILDTWKLAMVQLECMAGIFICFTVCFRAVNRQLVTIHGSISALPNLYII